MRIEDTILSSLFVNEEFARKAIPHLTISYFSDRSDGYVYDELSSYFLKYNSLPSKETIIVQLSQRNGLTESELETSKSKVKDYSKDPKNLDWLLERTEKFCKDRAVFNAVMRAITILDGKDKTHTKDSIPSLLQDALGISFDTAVGHSYLDDAAMRFDFYTRVEEKIAFDIELFNDITSGGLSRKTLTILLAQSGGGKSLVMSHMAAAALRQGRNVLYITMEMAEERIAERIDANLLNVAVDKLKDIGKDAFVTKIDGIAAKTHGRLFVKEYPTGAAHTGHFRGLLRELETKQNFKPDVIFVDYLAICASSRVKLGGSVNSYSYLKNVAEELRGLAVEENVAVVTAGQLNRGGYESSDVDLTDTSDSMGIVHTADLMLAIIRTEELDEMNQVMFKQLKNRYSDPNNNRRFVVGLNREKMKLYDLEKTAQTSFKKAETQTRKQPTVNAEDPFAGLPISSSRPPVSFDGFDF